MEFLFGMFFGLIGSFWVWPILVGLFLWGMVCAEQKEYFASTLMVSIIGLLTYFKFQNEFASLSVTLIGGVILTYTILGIVWSFFKWVMFVKSRKSEFESLRTQFLKARKLPDNFFLENNNGPEIIDFVEYFNKNQSVKKLYNYEISSYIDVIKNITPQASEKKSSIVSWGVFWPSSMVWYFLNDFVREVADYIFKKIKNLFQSVSDRIFQNS